MSARLHVRGMAALVAAGMVTVGTYARAEGEEGVFEKGVVEVEPADVPFESLAVDNRLGDVRVQGHDGGKVIIHTFKRGPDDEALDRLKVSLVPDPSGAIRISTRLTTGHEAKPLPAGSVRIDLVIHAPRSAAVKAEVWKGRVAVANMDNGAELRVNDGDIAVEHVSGQIASHTSKGTQRFSEVVGDIIAHGLLGDLDMQVVRGTRLEAMVQEGSVVGRKIRARHVSIGVMKGDVSFHGEVVLGGSYSITTYNGNVEVKLAKGEPMKVRARARKGEVKLPASLKPATREGGWVTGHHRRAGTPAVMQLATNVGNISVLF